jgi:hypothetical protein
MVEATKLDCDGMREEDEVRSRLEEIATLRSRCDGGRRVVE